MHNAVQQFLRKYANFYVKFWSTNEEKNLLKVSVLKEVSKQVHEQVLMTSSKMFPTKENKIVINVL